MHTVRALLDRSNCIRGEIAKMIGPPKGLLIEGFHRSPIGYLSNNVEVEETPTLTGHVLAALPRGITATPSSSALLEVSERMVLKFPSP